MKGFFEGFKFALRVLAVFAGALIVIPYIVPFSFLETLSSHVPLHGYGKTRCPMCGMTHSFYALSKGDLKSASLYNPAGPYLYFLFLIFLIVNIVWWFFDFQKSKARKP